MRGSGRSTASIVDSAQPSEDSASKSFSGVLRVKKSTVSVSSRLGLFSIAAASKTVSTTNWDMASANSRS